MTCCRTEADATPANRASDFVCSPEPCYKECMAARSDDFIPTLECAFAARAFSGVISAYLFGSYSVGRAHAESDVDLGVLLRHSAYPTARARFEARLRLIAQLQAFVGRQVDLVILNDTPPLLARRIVIAGRRVFCSDVEADHAFVRDVQLRAADLAPFIRRTRRQKLSAIMR